MRLPVLLLALAAGSAWMTESADPRRAGQSEAVANPWCPTEGCGLRLYPSGSEKEYVCRNRHVWRWDEANGEYVAPERGH